MGCSSSKASAPSTSAQPEKPQREEPTASPPAPITPEVVPTSTAAQGSSGSTANASGDSGQLNGEGEILSAESDEGPRNSGRLAVLAHGHKRVGQGAGRARKMVVSLGGDSDALPFAAKASSSPAGDEEIVINMSPELAPVDETANQVDLRTAAKAQPEDIPLGVPELSPFGSVPSEKLAKTKLFWKDMPAQEFNVRAAGYGTTHKNKESSDSALYNCVGVDVLKGGMELGNIFQHQKMKSSNWWREAGEGDWDKSWGVPRVLVVNCLLPIHSPMGFAKKPPGVALVAYFRLSQACRKELASGQVNAQMKLWQRLVKDGKSTREDLSFKAIGQLPEKSLSELPGPLQGYNGKPVLVTGSAAFIKDMLPEILEVDVDFGQWAFLARQTLYSYQNVLADHEFHMGYLVEGRAAEELPERMLACFCISGADLAAAVPID